MRTDSIIRAVLATITAIITTNGCASLTNFADPTSNAYRFEIVQNPENSATGWLVDVRLIDTNTGQPVGNAEIFKRQMVPAPSPKAVPAFQERLIPLSADGHGGYLYTQHNFHFGETLRLAARVPGKAGVIRGTVQLNG